MGGLVLLMVWLGVNYMIVALLAYRAERAAGVKPGAARAAAATWPSRLLGRRLA